MSNQGRPTVTLLVLAMNEIDGLREIMPRIDRANVDQIIIADGNSTDGTQEYARSMGYEVYPQVGKGGRNAFKTAAPHIKGDIVISFSPNGKSVPEIIPALVAKMREGYDMVIVSRYKDAARSADDTLISNFANKFFTTAINFIYRANYTDSMVIYRAYWTRLFRELDLWPDKHYPLENMFRTIVSIEPLLSVRVAKRHLRVTEIPGDEPPRIGGVNKFPKVTGGLIYFVQIIRELWHWK